MKKLRLVFFILSVTTIVYAYFDGPPAARTNAPREVTCNDFGCHQSFALNPDDKGSVALTGLPDGYIVGERYTLGVSVTHPDPDRIRWGFQVTALTQGTNNPAGDFPVTGNRRGIADPISTQKVTGGPGGLRQYMEHTRDGTALGQTGGNSWRIAWDAPSSNIGAVAFYAAGNAANGNDQSTGDKIYTNPRARNLPPLAIKGQLVFTEAAASANALFNFSVRTMAWSDFDQDGFPDLFVAGDGRFFLFRNDKGTLVDVTEAAGFNKKEGVAQMAVWEDYNGDGLPDLYVANEGQDFLFRNDGASGGAFTFTEVAAESGVGDDVIGRAAAWGDFDGDGMRDLFVVNDGQDFLYHNIGGGKFERMNPEAAGIVDDVVGRAVAWGDYDGDGLPDLYVVNDGQDFLYRNLGGGQFQERAKTLGIVETAVGLAVAWFDFDHDGKLDLFVVNEGPDALYRNLGAERFEDVTNVSGIAATTSASLLEAGETAALAIGDFDADGNLDVLEAKDGVVALFRNRGDGTFSQVIGKPGLEVTAIMSPRGAAWIDVDKDGNLDLFIASRDGQNALYRKEIK